MKKYIFNFLLGCATFTPSLAFSSITIVENHQTKDIIGKYQLVEEKREIIRDGQVIESSVSKIEDGDIYHFKGKDLVTVFYSGDPSSIGGINFKIKRKGSTYNLINRKAEAENDTLILLKNDLQLIIFQRDMEDGDDEGIITVRSTLHLTPFN